MYIEKTPTEKAPTHSCIMRLYLVCCYRNYYHDYYDYDYY